MGGALAQLAAIESKLAHNGTHTTVYTFGAPRVGNLAYQQVGAGEGGGGKGREREGKEREGGHGGRVSSGVRGWAVGWVGG